MTKTDLQIIYKTFLSTNGYKEIAIDGDGDVRFKAESGAHFYISVNEDTEDYFVLVLPNYYHNIITDAEVSDALFACNITNRRAKAAKTWMISHKDGGVICSSIEMFLPQLQSEKDINQFLFRTCISALLNSAVVFKKEMDELTARRNKGDVA